MKHATCFSQRLKRLFPATIGVAAILSAALATGWPGAKPLAVAPPAGKAATSFCACCADQGVWRQERYELDEDRHSVLAELKFQTARLHLTAAFPDDARGIAANEASLEEDFSLALARTAQQWTFTLTTRHGETGKLLLSLPRAATLYGADISPELTRRTPVTLYTELRFDGIARGTGIFAKGLAPGTKYRLVLQGNGNNCLQASDFFRWNLHISSAQAGFTLYGMFDTKPR